MSELKVNVVAADREVWSGTAKQVTARTTEGELGILAGHQPILAALEPGEVRIAATNGEVVAKVDGGFLSMEHNTVAIVAGALEVERDSTPTR